MFQAKKSCFMTVLHNFCLKKKNGLDLIETWEIRSVNVTQGKKIGHFGAHKSFMKHILKITQDFLM